MHTNTQAPGVGGWLRLLLGGLILTAGVAGAAPLPPLGPAWTATFDSPARFNEGSDIVVDGSGNAYVAGRSVADRDTGEADLVVVKYSITGRRLWSRFYPVPGGLGPDVQAALDGNANLVVAGSSETDVTNRDVLVVKYDSTGDLVWDFTFNGPNNGDEVPGAIAVDALGDVYVTGTAESLGVFSTDALTLKLAAASGTQLWLDRLVGETTDSHEIFDIVVDDAVGNVYITGRVTDQVDGNDAGSFFTRSFELSQGGVNWSATYDGPGAGSDGASALALTPDHDLVVTGRAVGEDGTPDFATIRYDASNGDPLWVRHFNGSAAGTDEAVALAVDAEGNVYVTGTSTGTVTQVRDYTTVKYAGATGNQMWAARYDGPGSEDELDGIFDTPAALAVDAAGNITVTGRVVIGNHRFAVGTIQYGPTGQRQWAHLYGGRGGNDAAVALALNNMDDIYIAGTSVTNSFRDDRAMLTLKYLSSGRRPPAPPTFTFTESSRDRLVCRREAGDTVCDETTSRTFNITSTATMPDLDLSTVGPATPFSLSVGGFELDATLADDPRYRAGKTSATFTETVLDDDDRERRALTVHLSWARGKLRVTVVGTAFNPDGILAEDYQDNPTGRITDTTDAAVTFGGFTQEFDVAVTGRVTTRQAQQGMFTLSTVTLSGRGTPP